MFCTEIASQKVDSHIFFTNFTQEKRLEINFSGQNFSVKNSHSKNLIHVPLNQNNDLHVLLLFANTGLRENEVRIKWPRLPFM